VVIRFVHSDKNTAGCVPKGHKKSFWHDDFFSGN